MEKYKLEENQQKANEINKLRQLICNRKLDRNRTRSFTEEETAQIFKQLTILQNQYTPELTVLEIDVLKNDKHLMKLYDRGILDYCEIANCLRATI